VCLPVSAFALKFHGLHNEECFSLHLGAQQQQDTLELGVVKLEHTVENLNLRLARLLGEYASSQSKLKQRISKLEEKYVNYKELRDGDEETLLIEEIELETNDLD
jgi:TolA-binding protein